MFAFAPSEILGSWERGDLFKLFIFTFPDLAQTSQWAATGSE